MMSADRIFPAIALRLVSVVCLATMAALIKLAEMGGAHLAEILFFRQAVGVPLVATVIAIGPGLATIRTGQLHAHVMRAVVGLTSMTCLFSAVTLLPLAESTTLQFTVPIFATILGALVLGEPTGWHRWLAVVAGFIGVLIVARPGSGHFALWGTVAGLAAGFLTAVVSIQLRRIGRTESPYTTVFWFATLSTVPLAVVYAFDHQSHSLHVWLLLISIGVAGNLGQIALTSALKLGPVSIVVPMDYSSLLWATLYGWLLFGALPGLPTWIGAPIVIGSGLYIVWREHVRRRTETEQAIV
ncbi:MAG: DMT family transporter [Candidatus Sphingomonas phytovorans]|nr:DMT family transporter [Sphingomonas sp.]WEK00689.1 MAG: DMT family transporter [Sphingomonas sp.]